MQSLGKRMTGTMNYDKKSGEAKTASTRGLRNVGLILDHRLRHWFDITPAPVKCFMIEGKEKVKRH